MYTESKMFLYLDTELMYKMAQKIKIFKCN